MECRAFDRKCRGGKRDGEPGVDCKIFPALTFAEGEAKHDHGREQRQPEQDKRQVVQASVPGGGSGANGWVGGKCQSGEGYTGTSQKGAPCLGCGSRPEVEKEAGGEDGHDESAEDERRGHDPSVFPKCESAGPVEGGAVNRMPAEAEHEIVLNGGESGKHKCKERGAEQEDAFHAGMITAPNHGAVCFIQGSGLEIFLVAVSPTAAVSVAEITRAVFRRAGNIDRDGAPQKVLAIEHADGLLGFLRCCHFDKAEALGAASGAVFDQCNRGDGSGLTEMGFEFVFGGGVGQVAYI